MTAVQPALASLASEMVVEGVSKGFGLGLLHQQVLQDCSFALERGKLSVMIGPSGCGKTTLINLLAGYESPDSGQILLDGKPISGQGPDRLVVFQETALFPWMTAFENVSYGPRVQRKLARKVYEEETMKLLELVGLKDFKDKYPSQLSGGMQRRAELVRAMINEPFRGLDAMTRALMQEYYVRLFEQHRGTNLFVTTELEEALFLADRLLILTNRPAHVKKVIEVGLPRPREFSMLTSREYQVCKQEALELLHEEAIKSFAAGVVNAADFLEAYAQVTSNK
jgi:NitT/TauT family transport system ATP-binding protein